MSPSPFAVTSPTDPASYSWEATDEAVAERFGIPRRAGAALRPQHVARAARPRRSPAARGPVRDQPVGVPARRLPEPRRGGRRRLRRHDRRDRPGRRRRRDPRHVHQGVPARGRGGRDLDPDVRDVPGPRRAARRQGHRRPPPSRGGGLGDGRRRPCATRLARPRSSGSATPTTPPASPSPTGAIEALLDGLEADAAADGRRHARRRRGRGVQRVHRKLGDPAADPVSRTSSPSARHPRPTRWPASASGSRWRRRRRSAGSRCTGHRAPSARSPRRS